MRPALPPAPPPSSTKRVTTELIGRRVVVRGRVQGVFFRDSVRRQADSSGVTGWVANRADGSVEVVLEGEPDAVERLIEFCRRGPSRAEVESVDVGEEEPQGLTGFSIR
jgi:acylphosphatase